jgi:hypothetical protein
MDKKLVEELLKVKEEREKKEIAKEVLLESGFTEKDIHLAEEAVAKKKFDQIATVGLIIGHLFVYNITDSWLLRIPYSFVHLVALGKAVEHKKIWGYRNRW